MGILSSDGKVVGVTVVSKGLQGASLVVLPVGPSVALFVDGVGSVPEKT